MTDMYDEKKIPDFNLPPYQHEDHGAEVSFACVCVVDWDFFASIVLQYACYIYLGYFYIKFCYIIKQLSDKRIKRRQVLRHFVE